MDSRVIAFVFLVKSFEIFQGFLGYFSFCHNIYFLSVSPDDICLDSIVLHDIIVKKTYYLSMYILYNHEVKLMKWKIIADSGCDYRSLDNLAPDTEFVSVPLTIQVGDTIYTDDAQLNIDQMMEDVCDCDCF